MAEAAAPLHGLAFEVRSIQSVILEGGRLRDMVAASELIDQLCALDGDDLLAAVLRALGLEADADLWFSRRAGAAFVAFSTSAAKLRELRALWTLVVGVQLPGVTTVTALEGGRDEAEMASRLRSAMDAARNRPQALMPVVGPLVRRAPRTGRPAVGYDRVGRELVDELTSSKRRATEVGDDRTRATRLTRKLEPTDLERPWRWPTVFELDAAAVGSEQIQFPLRDDGAQVGIVHADGNGFGQLLLELDKALRTAYADGRSQGRDYGRHFWELSKAIAAVTEQAARDAARRVLAGGVGEDEVVPARPIVLGGDDLTIILRADLALPFTCGFLEAFAAFSEERIAALRARSDLPILQQVLEGRPLLTAGAGIALLRASQPFHMGYQLAESLAEFAKSAARAVRPDGQGVPSCIAFHRVTTTLFDSYPAIRRHELSVDHGSGRRLLTMQPYVLEPNADLPSLRALEELTVLLSRPDAATGKLRQIIGMLQDQPEAAQQAFTRWYRVRAEEDQRATDEARRRGEAPKRGELLLDELRDMLREGFGIGDFGEGSLGFETSLPLLPADGGVGRRSPLLDALSWRAIMPGGEPAWLPKPVGVDDGELRDA